MKWNENKYDIHFIVNAHDNDSIWSESWTNHPIELKANLVKSRPIHNPKYVKSVLIGAFPCTRFGYSWLCPLHAHVTNEINKQFNWIQLPNYSSLPQKTSTGLVSQSTFEHFNLSMQSYRWKSNLCASEVDQFNLVLSFFGWHLMFYVNSVDSFVYYVKW